jgi:hypothetical protein
MVADAVVIEPVSTASIPDNWENKREFLRGGPNSEDSATASAAKSMACMKIPDAVEMGIFVRIYGNLGPSDGNLPAGLVPQFTVRHVAYTPVWEPLADAVDRLIAMGMNASEAKIDLCRAIDDGNIGFRVHLAADPARCLPVDVVSGAVLPLPSRLSPKHFDWRKSRPLSQWEIARREPGEPVTLFASRAMHLVDRSIELIEVRASDVSRVLTPPAGARTPAGAAVRRATTTINSETACKQKLIERMKTHPNDPAPKSELRRSFPELSMRGFNRVYSAAATEANCPAWSAAGRRRRNRSA